MEYLNRHGRRDDIPQIARDMLLVPSLVEPLLRWMADRGAPDAAFAPLRDRLDEFLARRLSGNSTFSYLATIVIGTIDDAQSAAYLRGLAIERQRYDLAAAGLSKATSEPSRAVMRELVVLETTADVEQQRSQLLRSLIDLADPAAPEVLSRAYSLGISTDYVALRSVLAAPAGTYAPASLAAMVEACLPASGSRVIRELSDARSLQAEILEVLGRHLFVDLDWEQWPNDGLLWQLLHSSDLAAHRALLERALSQKESNVTAVAVGAFSDPSIDIRPYLPRLYEIADADPTMAVALIDGVRTVGDPGRCDIARRYLVNSNEDVRRRAVITLMMLAPNDTANEIREGWEKGTFTDEYIFATVAGTSLDRRFVPLLLQAMRRPDADRARLKQALEAIQFYEEQVAHWQRFLDGSNLDANSAAEALLKQAGRDNKRVIRLMAIGSLGALGAPETLPFLIDYTEDPDAEIAAAAKAAVTQIQLAKRPGK